MATAVLVGSERALAALSNRAASSCAAAMRESESARRSERVAEESDCCTRNRM
jgi:hypothetical protein